MRPITLAFPYYLNSGMLRVQFNWLRQMHADVRLHLHLIVVDDCSPDPALPEPLACASLRMYRMLKDVPWNQDACRNLAVLHTTTKWVLLTDIDHLIPEVTLHTLMDMTPDDMTAYQFERQSVTSLQPLVLFPYKHHPNTWFMTKALYDYIGGYDERFAGYYGTDGDFRARVVAAGDVHRLHEHIIRVPRETIADASTVTLQRRSDENTAALLRIKAERNESAPWRPLTGLCAWEQTA